MCHLQIEEVSDINKSFQWLEKAGLKDRKALITAAKEQTISTTAVETRVYHTRRDPRGP